VPATRLRLAVTLTEYMLPVPPQTISIGVGENWQVIPCDVVKFMVNWSGLATLNCPVALNEPIEKQPKKTVVVCPGERWIVETLGSWYGAGTNRGHVAGSPGEGVFITKFDVGICCSFTM